jgi:hypothetical protein
MASKFKTWTAGEVLTAANLQSLIQNQVVIVCDSSAEYPTSPNAGMVVYDVALGAFLSYSGAAWVRIIPLTTAAVQTWDPVLTQSSAVAATDTSARYTRTGAVVDAWSFQTVTGSGTGARLTVSLPVTASGYVEGSVIGNGIINDGGTISNVAVVLESSGASVAFVAHGSTSRWATAVAPSDEVRFHVRYVV